MANTYDPARVVVSYNGIKLSGFADGTFVEADRDGDSFTKHVGADGEVARSANADKSGTVKVTLLQTAAANDLLSAELTKDELTRANTGSVFVKDLMGRTLVVGADAWLLRPAKVTLGKEVEGREWTIVVSKIEIVVGGNVGSGVAA